MARKNKYTYDPKTGKWNKSTVEEEEDKQEKKEKQQPKKTGDSGKNNMTSKNSDPKSSEGKTEKKYNTIEINTLSGTLNFIADKQTIKIKAGDTVKINGIGSHLSGDYYVQDVTRQIGSDGYTHSATLIKVDLGSPLATTSTGEGDKKKEEPKQVESTPKSENAQRTYTVKKGDCLWKIAKQFYGNGSAYKKIFEANRDKISNPDLIYTGQVFVIP